ncbi:MAG: GNAT family N-acetyltransferase [Gemmatimonadota bacterium]
MRTPFRRTYLELTDPTALRPPARTPTDTVMIRAEVPAPELGRFFYTAVGCDWFWLDRLEWTWAQWRALFDRPGYELHYALQRGVPAGYFELDATKPPEAEILYFGLLPRFVGEGIGGWLLAAAVRRACELGAGRIWLHTCTLDGPMAVKNYLARGFRVFKEETLEAELPITSPGPWPGAQRPRPFP